MEEKYLFPKRIGIIFPENVKNKKESLHLSFDQEAFAYLLLQMNRFQSIFEFCIIEPNFGISKVTNDGKITVEYNTLPATTENLFNWLDNSVVRFQARSGKNSRIDYWISFTSQALPGEGSENWFFNTLPIKKTKSQKRLWLITSSLWERYFSPPSLFEYLALSVFRCSLESLSRELVVRDELPVILETHDRDLTAGCIFDFTKWKPYRKIMTANPNLCIYCRQVIKSLEKSILEKSGILLPLYNDINTILSRTWIGSPKKRDSPFFNLKKIYKYDVDRNSGYYKKNREKFRDSIIDNSAQWVVGSLIGAIITGVVAVLIAVVFGSRP